MANLVGLLSVASVAICLVPVGAHLAELPGKMRLAPAQYMSVQGIYSGWALFGVAIAAALALTLWHAVVTWRGPKARWLSLGAFAALAATQGIFWAYTYPMNVLTRNWTVMPDNLEAVRRQWEWSHAASAVLTFVALVLIAAAAMEAARK